MFQDSVASADWSELAGSPSPAMGRRARVAKKTADAAQRFKRGVTHRDVDVDPDRIPVKAGRRRRGQWEGPSEFTMKLKADPVALKPNTSKHIAMRRKLLTDLASSLKLPPSGLEIRSITRAGGTDTVPEIEVQLGLKGLRSKTERQRAEKEATRLQQGMPPPVFPGFDGLDVRSKLGTWLAARQLFAPGMPARTREGRVGIVLSHTEPTGYQCATAILQMPDLAVTPPIPLDGLTEPNNADVAGHATDVARWGALHRTLAAGVYAAVIAAGEQQGLVGVIVANAEESGHTASQIRLRGPDQSRSGFIKLDCLRVATEDEKDAYDARRRQVAWCQRGAHAKTVEGAIGVVTDDPDGDGYVWLDMADGSAHNRLKTSALRQVRASICR